MTHYLASIQAQGCFLQHGWRLNVTQLRHLAVCIGRPAPRLRRIQEHPILAAHLAMAVSADWLAADQTKLLLRPTVYMWLRQGPKAQVDALLAALNQPVNWAAAIDRFRLRETLDPAMTAYLNQQLTRCRRSARPAQAHHPLHIVEGNDRWRIQTRAAISTESVFHLHQFADCQGERAWQITPFPLSRREAAR